MYGYQLQRLSDYTVIYSGSETNTFISLDNLKPDTGYKYGVRVSASSMLTGYSRSSRWFFITARTAPKPTTLSPTTPRPITQSPTTPRPITQSPTTPRPEIHGSTSVYSLSYSFFPQDCS